MNRRGFLKSIGVLPAVVAVPLLLKQQAAWPSTWRDVSGGESILFDGSANFLRGEFNPAKPVTTYTVFSHSQRKLVAWYRAEDAVTDADGNVVYWPDSLGISAPLRP